MRFLIVTPAARNSTHGNRITAQRWARILRCLGHQAVISESYSNGKFDVLVALHARKSSTSVKRFSDQNPNGLILVAMTGTDLHVDMAKTKTVAQTLEKADHIILLEPYSQRFLLSRFQEKCHVILQSCVALTSSPPKLKRSFEVSVVGHLREIKDPFRTAYAARLLPETSRVRVVHFGKALTRSMESQAKKEARTNNRYRWYGAVNHSAAVRRLARSRLTVLSSKNEGAPAVISEAIVNGVPVLATRIPATLGLLGNGYPGFFKYRDTSALALLIERAETEPEFYRKLLVAGKNLKVQFGLDGEIANWKALIETF